MVPIISQRWKERHYFMLSASKILGVIKRKRKKSFKAFDPLKDKEENKDFHIKWEKFTEDNNVKITHWSIQK